MDFLVDLIQEVKVHNASLNDVEIEVIGRSYIKDDGEETD